MKCFSSFAISAELTVGADMPATGSRWTLNLVSSILHFQCTMGRFDKNSLIMFPPTTYKNCRHNRMLFLFDNHLWRNQSSTGFHFWAWSSSSSGGSTQWKRIVSVSKKSIICFTWMQQRCMISCLVLWSLTSPVWAYLVVADCLDMCSPAHSCASEAKVIVESSHNFQQRQVFWTGHVRSHYLWEEDDLLLWDYEQDLIL